ncbi:Fc.00g067620.m01.CDS01 [Cosmosporella sp. VM-42]
MRFTRPSRSLLLIIAAAGPGSAGPYPRDNLHDVGYSFLMPRGCDKYCGSDNQFCCGSNEVCTTLNNDVATCVGGGGYVDAYTTTWTETHTYTSTIMTFYAPAPEPTAGVDCVPQEDDQEKCGPICCAGWQTCAYDGQCSAKPGLGDGTTVVITSNGKVTTQYSAPYRVTGTTTVTTSGVRSETGTSTGTAATATATSDNDTIGAGGGGTGSHLSGGAIAGIVIGTIAGVALLLLLCFCCIVRGIWGLLFGKKDKDKDHSRERVDVYEERYSRHGSHPPPSAHSRRDRHKGWFGGGSGPSSAGDRRSEKKKSSGGGKWLGIAGLAATLLALLNLKKDKRPARMTTRVLQVVPAQAGEHRTPAAHETAAQDPTTRAPHDGPDLLRRRCFTPHKHILYMSLHIRHERRFELQNWIQTRLSHWFAHKVAGVFGLRI